MKYLLKFIGWLIGCILFFTYVTFVVLIVLIWHLRLAHSYEIFGPLDTTKAWCKKNQDQISVRLWIIFVIILVIISIIKP